MQPNGSWACLAPRKRVALVASICGLNHGRVIRSTLSVKRLNAEVDSWPPVCDDRDVKVSEIIGKRVRQAREEEGLSQRDLGEKVGELLGRAWFPQAVSAAEKGRRDWTADDLVAVAWALHRPVGWFFGVMDEDRGNMLDFERAQIHAYTLAGNSETRTPEEMIAEVVRLGVEIRQTLEETAAGSSDTSVREDDA